MFTEDELVELISEFYSNDDPKVIDGKTGEIIKNACGGLLHIVLDDGNLGDESINFCLAEAQRLNDTRAVYICRLLLTLDEQSRDRIYDRYDEYGY